MTSPDHHDALTERLAQLEARLEARIEHLGKATFDYLETLKRHLTLIDRGQAGAFERLKNLELKFFPHLRDDLSQMYNIIGDGEDNAENPLDRRPPHSPPKAP